VWVSFALDYTLNSLFGISFVVTIPNTARMGEKDEVTSQFPFWDFFCCNSVDFGLEG
jgi:hypothetical protein